MNVYNYICVCSDSCYSSEGENVGRVRSELIDFW